MSQVLITAAFMFLFHFPSTLMAELKVESDKENVVSSRLEGRWQANKAISNRLSTRLADHNQSKTVEFHADDKIVAKIPGKYGKFLKRKTIYMAEFYARYSEHQRPSQALFEVQSKWLRDLRRDEGAKVAAQIAGPFFIATQGAQ